MTQIHVPLVDEGTDVWRPVTARQIAPGVYEIAANVAAPADETWMFGPGDQVRCEERTLSGGVVLVAVERVHAAG